MFALNRRLAAITAGCATALLLLPAAGASARCPPGDPFECNEPTRAPDGGITVTHAGTSRSDSAGRRNALRAAQSYLQTSAFSKSGLEQQLEYDQFSRSDARWAVNHVRVSWYAEAVKAAKSYLQTSAFSRQDLIDQLEYDGFTAAQAAYGVRKAYH